MNYKLLLLELFLVLSSPFVGYSEDFATLGSNTFDGDQTVLGRVNIGVGYSMWNSGGSSVIDFPCDERLSIGSIGGFENDGGLSHYWRGVHFCGDTISVNGDNKYPRLVVYSVGQAQVDPSYINYYIRAGNASVKSNINIRAENNGDILLNAGDTDGNVGIGTTSPSRKLDVVGLTRLSRLEVRDSGDTRIDIYPLSGSNNRESLLRFSATFDNFPRDTGTRLVSQIRSGFDGGTWGTEFMAFGVGGAGDSWNSTAAEEKMRITATGNVGIGVTDPRNKLDVNGTIRAKEIIVASDWADFVFEDDYELMPLTQVQSYIQKNKRLPGLPSAEEVQEQGVSLGEMQTVMLQKVEELTLHVIDLQEQNAKQQKVIDLLLKRLNETERKESE